MRYGKHDNLQVVGPEYDVKRKNRSARVTIENQKSVRRIGDETNHAIQLIENRTAARTLPAKLVQSSPRITAAT